MILNKADKSFILSLLESGVEALLLNCPHSFAGNLKCDEYLLCLRPEFLGLEVEGEIALCAEFGVSDIVADHPLSSCDLTNFCHDIVTFLLIQNKLRGTNFGINFLISKKSTQI